ncbi:MAG: GIY-YIG nuclease family protein [Tissierellia bacterium]|nr:GIY-YIG nuclease family protein [Sedimentibacter sp.]NLA12868.1 GIY-YIG nuclease family protein [Tissierellia bacterium]
MKGDKVYYVYILTNKYNKVLYVGITNDLIRRIYEHKNNLVEGFTSKYNVHKLVYYDLTSDVMSAITREKQIKGWTRDKKIKLIESMNPEWKDLYYDII